MWSCNSIIFSKSLFFQIIHSLSFFTYKFLEIPLSVSGILFVPMLCRISLFQLLMSVGQVSSHYISFQDFLKDSCLLIFPGELILILLSSKIVLLGFCLKSPEDYKWFRENSFFIIVIVSFPISDHKMTLYLRPFLLSKILSLSSWKTHIFG